MINASKAVLKKASYGLLGYDAFWKGYAPLLKENDACSHMMEGT